MIYNKNSGCVLHIPYLIIFHSGLDFFQELVVICMVGFQIHG